MGGHENGETAAHHEEKSLLALARRNTKRNKSMRSVALSVCDVTLKVRFRLFQEQKGENLTFPPSKRYVIGSRLLLLLEDEF